MMTVPMDNPSGLSSRERVQRLYKKNVELENKRRKAAQARVPTDPNLWQQMRENYETIVTEDHSFSEQHEIEYALWQLHYRRIEELRAHFSAALASNASTTTSQSGKGSIRPDRVTKIRSQFKTFLSEATGFYHDLLLKIRAMYGLSLGFFSDDPDNQIVVSKGGNKPLEMKKGLISCHRCLIYLGDLARYKGLYGEGDSKTRDFAAASSYYTQASSLWPSSGNPHHQLAILSSYSGDELVSVYRYFRSLAVDNPFSTARDNLIIAFEKNRQSYTQLVGDAKAPSVKTSSMRLNGKGRGKGDARHSLKDNKTEASPVKGRVSSIPETYKAFSIRFVRLNGILFTRTSLETFGEIFSTTRSDFIELLSSGSEEDCNFGSTAADCRLLMVRLVAILIFTVHNVNKETENQSYAEILQRSVLLQNAFIAVFEFMGQILERCIQLHDPSSSYLLPSVLIFVEWLACHPDIVPSSDAEEKQSNARSFFWNNCVSFLNKLLSSGFMLVDEDKDETCFFNMSRYDEGETANRLALWEDVELRGFLPLVPAQLILDFSSKHSFGSDDGIKEKQCRVQRIVAAGKALANLQQVIYFDSKLKKFAIGFEPQMSNDGSAFELTSCMEVPTVSSMGQEFSVERKQNVGVLQPKMPLYIEGEEEDEVIVFKPTVTDKHVNAIASEVISHDVLVSDSNNCSKGDMGSYVAPPYEGILLQNAFDTSFRPPSSFPNIAPQQHHQAIQPNISNWLVESQACITNGLNNLSFVENGFSANPVMQPPALSRNNLSFMENGVSTNSVMQPPALSLNNTSFVANGVSTNPVMQSPVHSLSYPQSVNLGAGNIYSDQVSEIPSKFDSIMSSGAAIFDSLSVKSSALPSANVRKNPVSRPVRHFGPPPGFSRVTPKQADEPLSSNMKNENPPMDDYSWLDGYQLPSSTQGAGFNNSGAQTFNHASKSKNLMENLSFPFPGKQIPALQVQGDNQKWQDYQFSNQQQFQKGNQHFIPNPEQYQGQSLWEGRFFV